jgi:hypothetical protein
VRYRKLLSRFEFTVIKAIVVSELTNYAFVLLIKGIAKEGFVKRPTIFPGAYKGHIPEEAITFIVVTYKGKASSEEFKGPS